LPDVLYPLSRRLLDLEEAARPLRPTTVPDCVVVQRFLSDSIGAVDAYLMELEATFAAAEVDPVVVVVDVLADRPPALREPWSHPKQWVDYVPDDVERNQGRPDLYKPPAPRVDWTGEVVEPPSRIAPVAFQEALAPVPVGIDDNEHIQALRRSLDRWQRGGGALADLDLGCAADDQVDVVPAPAPAAAPEPQAPTLRLGGGRRPGPPAVLQEFGPLGGSAR